MSLTVAEFAIDSWKKITAYLLLILQVSFGMPQTAHATTKSVIRQSKPSAMRLYAGSALASARVALAAAEARTDLATRAALAALLPPSEFAQLTSHFAEPLIATGSHTGREDKELTKALEAFQNRSREDDFSAISSFLKEHPKSAWRVGLLTNLGLLNYHYGYFSQALSSWAEAWQEGRSYSDPKVHVLVDRAVGELARMHARLGHADELEALFKDLGNRQVTGPATEAIAGAREGLAVMRTDPGIAYLCGPMALKNLLLAQNTPYKDVQFLDAVRSGPHGVTLQQVSALAAKAKLRHTVIFRTAGQPVPVPSIIHWKVSHFAAIVGENGDRIHVIDPTFGTDLWITKSAIDAESDGYFLVPTQNPTFAWRQALDSETAQVRGMGYPGTVDDGATTPDDTNCQQCSAPMSPISTTPVGALPPLSDGASPSPMAVYSFTEMVVSLHISDTPVGYTPPIGPSVKVMLNYNQRESDQPATFSYFNISQKWTLNWLSYIQDDPRSAGGSVSRYVAGGGDISYSGYNGTNGTFTPETRDASVLSRTTTGAIIYKRSLADGSVETYSASNGATTYPRLVFLTLFTDRSGNSVSLNYDNQRRLTSLTDATGRSTTFSYGLASNPLLVTQITDPFGRSAQLTYDASGRLSQITDILGLTSRFTYDSSSLINAMTTPYGTTNFTYGANGTYRYLAATDPLGHTERVEWDQPAPTSSNLPFSEPAALVPVGIVNPFNQYITGRDTFYWDKHAYAVAAGNYSQARIRHWMHNEYNTNQMYHSLESYKYPLENRVWYNYPNQSSTGFSGSLDYPTGIGRVLDDGTTQLTKMTYNAQGHVTDTIDPMGRETQFIYAANGIDLLTVKQKTAASAYSTVAQFTYNSTHLPLTHMDAAGQTTTFTYNSAGQILTATDALGETTTYSYNGLGYLGSITNANSKTQASFTYDQYGRVSTATDSEGYVVNYAYDAANRVTQETFPDGTARKFTWTNLDVTSVTDRQSNTTQYAYDAIRNLLSTTDPLSHVTRLGYWENQSLKTLTDPNGNTTTWNIDVQNRVTGKQYADGTQIINGYENTTSRLRTITDAMAQVKTFTYAKDDTLSAIGYTHAVNTTPNVSFAYDPYFRRITSMTDGNGIRNYTYQAIGSPGALQLIRESGPFTNDSIAYQYDALSRLASRTVDTSTETFAYDALSRLVTHGTALGTFNLGYLGQTGQLISQQISTGTVGTNWAYDSNTNDRRLLSITNSGATRSFNYTTTPENLITQIKETAPATAAYAPKTWSYTYDSAYRLATASASGSSYTYGLDAADNITSIQTPSSTTAASYNNLNQILSYGSQAYIYDKNGNVLDDGVRTYGWDAENRLLSVSPKSNTSQRTTFNYDGLGRRTAIATANNGIITNNRYLWCGQVLCQARTKTDEVLRRYYTEGEYLPAGGTSLYYSQDHLGSVRDVLATQTGTRVASFDYDPHGGVGQSSGRVSTDFRYSGLFYDQQDGLYLANFRSLDPRTGQWLSRDPASLKDGLSSYAYAAGNAILNVDPEGLRGISTIIKTIPPDAIEYITPDCRTFYAPPQANFGDIYAAGRLQSASFWNLIDPESFNPLIADYYIGHWGIFDYQRSGSTFISAYTNVSNYDVGIFMNAAGFSLDETLEIGQLFAGSMSSNAGSSSQKLWWMEGWNAGQDQTFATPSSSGLNGSSTCSSACPR